MSSDAPRDSRLYRVDTPTGPAWIWQRGGGAWAYVRAHEAGGVRVVGWRATWWDAMQATGAWGRGGS